MYMHRWRMQVETQPYVPLAGIMRRVVISSGAGSLTRSEGTRVCDVQDRLAPPVQVWAYCSWESSHE
jgi:hypothetical protein